MTDATALLAEIRDILLEVKQRVQELAEANMRLAQAIELAAEEIRDAQ